MVFKNSLLNFPLCYLAILILIGLEIPLIDDQPRVTVSTQVILSFRGVVRKKSVVARGNTESEYCALADATAELL